MMHSFFFISYLLFLFFFVTSNWSLRRSGSRSFLMMWLPPFTPAMSCSIVIISIDSLGRPPTRVLHDGGSVFLAFHNNGEKGLFSCFSCLQVFQLFLYYVLHGWYVLREILHVLFYSFSSLALLVGCSGGRQNQFVLIQFLFSLDLHPFGWMKGASVPLNVCVFLVLGLLFSN